MKEIVLITGANGMLARNLSKLLQEDFQIRFLTRKKSNENEFEWNVENRQIDVSAFKNVSHIIHLAGAGIADKKWTRKRKKIIASSRIDTAKLILNTLKKHQIKITSLISASAIGYYGTKTSETIYTENMKKGNGFISEICDQWECVANQFDSENVSKRTIIFRIGIVLSRNGGALKKMMLPIKYFMGAVLGKGSQYISWIHIDDLSRMITYGLKNRDLNGTYNAVSPNQVTNREFTHVLAKDMRRPILLPNIPSFIIKLIFGSRAILLLEGIKVSSEKIRKTGFEFKYHSLKNALQNL